MSNQTQAPVDGLFDRDTGQLVGFTDGLNVFQSPVSGGGAGIVLLAGGQDSAAANTAAIQSALDVGGSVRLVQAAGQAAYISSRLLIGDETTLDIGDVELIAAPGLNGSMLATKAFAASATAVSLSWSSGLSATVTWTGHPMSAGEYVWLNRADQGQFSGVFCVSSVTNANTFVVALKRQPTAAPTGSVVAKKANRHVAVTASGKGVLNYNYPANTGSGTGTFAIILAGCHRVSATGIRGKNTMKYLVCFGAVSKYIARDIGGDLLASDTVKIYGPAHDGVVESLHSSAGGDDLCSIQTREPSAYAAYDFTQGDIIGLSVVGISGKTTTSGFVAYPSPYGLIDQVSVSNVSADCDAGLFRVETLYPSPLSEVGVMDLSESGSQGSDNYLILGSGANPLTIRRLRINSASMRSAAYTGRFLAVSGTAVTANIEINGGYIDQVDNVLNVAAGSVIKAKFNSTQIGASYNTFRIGASGTMNVTMDSVELSANHNTLFSNSGGSPTVVIRSLGSSFTNGPVLSWTGTPVVSVYSPDFPLDVGGASIVKTVANQECVNSGTGRGTLVQNRRVICNGTNWVQVDTPANVY